MNVSRARRRWKAWDRYALSCYKIGGEAAVPSGYSRAAGERYRLWLRKRGGPDVAAAADLLAVLDRSGAAA